MRWQYIITLIPGDVLWSDRVSVELGQSQVSGSDHEPRSRVVPNTASCEGSPNWTMLMMLAAKIPWTAH